MRSNIVVVDDFYADPLAVRDYALRERWYYPYYPDADIAAGRPFAWATTWFREAADCPFKSSTDLVDRLQEVTGDRIEMDHWKASFPTTEEGKASESGIRRHPARTCLWNCSFHVKAGHHDQQLGTGVHNHVSDRWNGVGPNGWAGLVYLSPDAPLDGGLSLWENVDPEHNLDTWTPAENWRRVDALGNRFNRLILVRVDVPHSGAKGWGSGFEDSRLFQTFFFRVIGPAPSPSLEIPGLQQDGQKSQRGAPA